MGNSQMDLGRELLHSLNTHIINSHVVGPKKIYYSQLIEGRIVKEVRNPVCFTVWGDLYAEGYNK